MKKILFCLFLISLVLRSKAQGSRELMVGERLPDLQFKNVLNHTSGTFKLSKFKGKLILLDFMGTYCVSCIEAFPELEDLQRKFRDSVQILVVTANTKEEWQKLASRSKLVRNLKLPVITADTLLASYFPHVYVPHEVWLGPSREVKAITTGEYVTASNIRQVLSGVPLDWAVKRDLGNYDLSVPMLLPKDEEVAQPLYYSTLSGHRRGTLTGSKKIADRTSKTTRLTVINSTILNLYRRTLKKYPLIAKAQQNRFVLEVNDRAAFIYDKEKEYKDRWSSHNTFCYEIVAPLSTSEEAIFDMMRQDLNRYLRLNGRVERRTVPCYVLKKVQGGDGGDAAVVASTKNSLYKTSGDLVAVLNELQPLPILDETGLVEINMPDIGFDILDIERVKKRIAPYGLELVKAERNLEVFVITER